MPLQSNMNEKEVLDFIFKQNSQMEPNEKEKNINTYYAIKLHLPSDFFKSGRLKFSYNKGFSYISAIYGEILIFSIPNEHNKFVKIICPADEKFINSLTISDNKKENTINNQRDKKLDYWYAKLTPDEVLGFSTNHWTEFTNICESLAKK